MADFSVVFDPMLDKERAEFVTGGTGGGVSYVAGEGIAIAGQTIYTADVPQSAVSGLSNSLAAKQDVLTASFAGYRMSLDSGTMNFSRVANIVNATGATVTLEPDTAYKVFATTQAVTLNANAPASGQWGLEGHIELFVAGTGYVVTGSNVVLANALEPDSVNNCTVRFHDGLAIISVEDHVAGYIVTVNAASGAGSLAYGLATATNEYISVDASLNGHTLDLAGAVTNGEKHVVGNGYTETIISGGINCTSKTTLSNLAADGVIVSSGTLTLGDVFIPSGSTVAVSGGGLAVEKVTGNGGVVDLGGNAVVGNGSFSEVTLSGGTFASGTLNAVGGAVVELEMSSGTSMNFTNSNAVELVSGTSANITLTSGAILDLTGNTNATPIAPGGGITFEAGGATVYPSAGQASAYSFEGDAISLANSNTVNVDRNLPSHASGCDIVFTNASPPVGPQGGSSSIIEDCSLITSAGSIFITGYGGNGTLVLGGTVTFNKQMIGANAAAKANVTLLDNTTVSCTAAGVVHPINCQAGALIVGSNCTLDYTGNKHSINGGNPTSGTRLDYTGVVE